MTTTTKPVPKSAMSKEPAVITGGTISVALWAIIGILKAYDIVIPEDVGRNVDILINLIAGIPAVAGFVTRFLVYSPKTVQELVNDAATTGTAADVAPPPPTKSASVPKEQWGTERVKREREGSPTV